MQPDRTAAPRRACCASASSILDGAMGTMIQRYRLGEADFRGALPRRPPARPQGRQRPAGADAARRRSARSTTRTSRRAPTSSRPTPSTRRRSRRPTTACEAQVREINRAAARIARECADAWTARTPDKPRFVAGALGPDQPHGVDLARRQRPGRAQRHVSTSWSRPTPRRSTGWSRAAPTCCWSRRSSTR